ncbi:MAG: hypothetical protein ACI92G_003083 [Candidatus Pelagisphaera sp.]|jgi:hypothetical protein|tara:strand:- start:266 stop:520 length:255 start_codon:yes stop_codon:yes gene_type:complete
MRKFAIKWAMYREKRATLFQVWTFAIGALAFVAIGLIEYIESKDILGLFIVAGGIIIALRSLELYGFSELLKELRAELRKSRES